jgi:hypothetical protein
MEKTIDEENILISFFLEERTIGRMKGRIYFPLFGKKKKGKEIFFLVFWVGMLLFTFFFFIRCYFKFKIKVKIRNLIFLPFTSLFL